MLYYAADAHLTKRVWKHRAALEGDAARAWQLMVAAIIADDAEDKVLILAGDTMDFRMIDGTVLQELDEGISDLFAAKVGVLFTQGNHDKQAVNHLEALGCIPLDGISMEVQGMTVYGLDYLPRESLVPALHAAPECDLLVMHAAGQHLLGFKGAYDYTLEALVDCKAKDVLVGDIHITDVTTRACGMRVISPGSLHPLNITEGDSHGFYKMDPTTKKLEFVKIRTREIHRMHAWTEEEFTDEVLPFLRELPTIEPEYRPIVELAYTPDIAGLVIGTVRTFADFAVFFLDEQIRLEDGVDMGARPVYKQAGMLEALNDLPRVPGEENAMELLRGALGSVDPDNYIEEYAKEVLV